jgi:hypothetical protein
MKIIRQVAAFFPLIIRRLFTGYTKHVLTITISGTAISRPTAGASAGARSCFEKNFWHRTELNKKSWKRKERKHLCCAPHLIFWGRATVTF